MKYYQMIGALLLIGLLTSCAYRQADSDQTGPAVLTNQADLNNLENATAATQRNNAANVAATTLSPLR